MSAEIGLNVTQVDTIAQFKLGTIMSTIGTTGPDKTYKYVQYSTAAGAVAAVAGRVAYYEKTATGDSTCTIVTSDVSESDEVGAGILQAAMLDNQYGWVQVSGLAIMSLALTAGVAGDPLTPTGATDGTLDVVAAFTDAVCAYSVNTTTRAVLCAFPY